MYEGMKDKAAQAAFLDAHLAKFPNSFTALANKGLMAVNDNNAEEGAKWLRKAAVAKPDNAVVWTYLGACLSVLAANATDNANAQKLYDEPTGVTTATRPTMAAMVLTIPRPSRPRLT